MSTIEKLTSIKNRILDKMITKEGVSEYKERLILRGSYFKQIFKYVFLKKFKFKDKLTSVDLFFAEGGAYNVPKIVGAIDSGMLSVLTFIGFLSGYQFQFFIATFTFFFTLHLVIYFIVSPIRWIDHNKSVNKKFNPENLAEIKETIFKNYDEKDIKQLFKRGLKKEELIDIFKEIEELIGEEYFLEVFERLNLHKQEKDISDPYILLLVINGIIENIEKNKKTDSEKNNIKRNQEIINSLLKESDKKEKEKEKICEYLK